MSGDLERRAAELEARLWGVVEAARNLGSAETPASAALPRPGSFKPGVVQVRLIGPPEAIAAADEHLADLHGDAWQPSTRKASRHDGGDQLMYGTLIVPVPR